MAEVSHCPEAQSLQRFLLGQSTPEEATALEKHLDQCNVCLDSLQTLHEDDSMVEALQAGSNAATAGAAHEGVRLLSEWLKKLRPTDQKLHSLFAPKNAAGANDTEAFVKSRDGESTITYEFLVPSLHPTELGRLGQYQIKKVLGAGGMGVVFEAYDPGLDRLVALKTMLPAHAAVKGAKQRFLREAKAAAKIKHNHIVTIYHVDEDRDIAFLAMEYLEGETLEQRLRHEARLPLAEVLRISRECADALSAAHSSGLIHRDVKPANIWLERTPGNSAGLPRVKLLDFGLALRAADDAHLTQSGAIVGTPAFMAPEQIRGLTVDARADLFSLGCVMYRMATGEAPFKGTHSVSTLIAVATINPSPPQEVNPDLPIALSDLIMRLLAKSPEDRPANALEVAEAIGAIERGRSQTTAAPDSSVKTNDTLQTPGVKEPKVPTRRRSFWPIGLGVTALLLAGFVGWMAYPGGPRLKDEGSKKKELVEQVKPKLVPPDEMLANTVSGEGISPAHVHSDSARCLQDVGDFRDIIGASASELRAWQGRLESDFRLSQVTCRRGNGPTLFNAVAIREKAQRLVRFAPRLLSPAAIKDDYEHNHVDGFALLDQCTYADKDGENGWAQARLWIKNGSDYHSWRVDTLEEIKAEILAKKNEGRPLRCLEWLPVPGVWPYHAVFAVEQGRRWEIAYALTAQDLLQAVQRLKRKGWRPDLVTPYWEDKQLLFVMAAVENNDGPDWRFRMDMTAESYQTESLRQRQLGWFPVSLVSHGNGADLRYVAIWVRGRPPLTPPPPINIGDARARADRAAKIVSFVSSDSKANYVDGGRALAEIDDFRELVGGTSQEFRDWHEKLDPKFRISHVTSRNGAGPTLFNAVAVRDKILTQKDPLPWRIHIEQTGDMGDKNWKQNQADGFRMIADCSNLSPGQKLPWNGTALWVKDGQDFRMWHGWIPNVVEGNKVGISAGLRPIYMSARMSPDGLGANTVLGPVMGRGWEAYYTPHLNDLLVTIEFFQRKGWRPDFVLPYLDGDHWRSLLIVVENNDKVDWRFRMDMSHADYVTESAQQKRRGLFPVALASYGNDDDVRYSAVFVRYRQPVKD